MSSEEKQKKILFTVPASHTLTVTHRQFCDEANTTVLSLSECSPASCRQVNERADDTQKPKKCEHACTLLMSLSFQTEVINSLT